MVALCGTALFYGGSEQVKMVHSFVYDGDQNKDFIRALGVRLTFLCVRLYTIAM